VPGVGILDDGGYVVGKEKFRIIFPVENEKELMFRVLGRDTLQ
jgi:hypothetical protein